MKVHLIKKQSIMLFAERHARSRVAFMTWIEKIKYAEWNTPTDIQRTFAQADLLGRNSNRVVFDLCGNEYRMICKYAFGENNVHLFVCWIGTHASYSKICRSNKQYTIKMF